MSDAEDCAVKSLEGDGSARGESESSDTESIGHVVFLWTRKSAASARKLEKKVEIVLIISSTPSSARHSTASSIRDEKIKTVRSPESSARVSSAWRWLTELLSHIRGRWIRSHRRRQRQSCSTPLLGTKRNWWAQPGAYIHIYGNAQLFNSTTLSPDDALGWCDPQFQ